VILNEKFLFKSSEFIVGDMTEMA